MESCESALDSVIWVRGMIVLIPNSRDLTHRREREQESVLQTVPVKNRIAPSYDFIRAPQKEQVKSPRYAWEIDVWIESNEIH